jgi:hypothetical protein
VYLRILLNVLSLFFSAGRAQAPDNPAEEAQARRAVEQSLPFLEREGVAWMKEKACASCHHVPFLLWSHNEAGARGVRVAEEKLAEWTGWSWRFSQTRRGWFRLTNEALDQIGPPSGEMKAKLKEIVERPFSTEAELLTALRRMLTEEQLLRYGPDVVKRAARPREPENDGGGLDTLCQLVLGRDRTLPRAQTPRFAADLRDLILRWQEPNGSWKASGQLPLQARPAAESDVVTTAWSVAALLSLDPSDASARQAVKRAVDFLDSAKPGQSNEWLIASLLVERSMRRSPNAKRLLAELLSRQNEDGGWGWRQGAESDAFATGQALYALSRCGPSGRNAVQRARGFLVKTQEEDGSWRVRPDAISSTRDPGRLARLAPIYRYWGTGWATIGLCSSLPASARRSSFSNAGRSDPWMGALPERDRCQ